MTEESTDLNAYLSVLRRRKKQFLVPALMIFLVGAVVAFVLPPVYRSTVTILIEQEGVPEALVPTTGSSYVSQRLALVSQRVMTTASLTAIVEKFDPYAKRDSLIQSIVDNIENLLRTIVERFANPTLDTLVEKVAARINPVPSVEWSVQRLRSDIARQTVSATTADSRVASVTIAFVLAYQNSSPEMAQQVAEELANLYLKENTRARTQAVRATKTFLDEEAARVNARIRESEAEVAGFKEKYAGNLPQDREVIFGLRQRAIDQLSNTEGAIQSVQERIIYLQSDLARLDPFISSDGARLVPPEERLRILQAEYASKVVIYAENHPDLVALRKEIAALRLQVGGGDGVAAMAAELVKLQAELEIARERYSSQHPDVMKLERSVANLENQLRVASVTQSVAQLPTAQPTNPTYIDFAARLEATKSELRSLQTTRSKLTAQIGSYDEHLSKIPQLEREFSALQRELEAARAEHQEIRKKKSGADLAAAVEEGQKGERFSILEPPLPGKLVKPNRKAILLFSFVLALGGGIGRVAFAESLDQTVRNSTTVQEILGDPPLATIPYIGRS